VIVASFTIDWYAARAAGLVAYLLVSSSVALGLFLAGKERLRRWPRFALEDVHRFAGLLAGTFIAVHVLLIGIDSQAHLGLGELIVPFASHYRPFWTGMGIVAAELLIALAVTNHYRKRLPHTIWRRFHYLNFAVWLAATGHGLGAGTDSGAGWFITLYVVTTTTIVLLAIRRFSGSRQPTRPPRKPESVGLEPGST
jgi:methionine sulfoxide reductase heme-binding subunit